MKRMLTYMATGVLFLVGATGVTQAEGYYYNAREDCCTEGPPYNREFKKGPDIPTKVVFEEQRYIEGMGFAPRPEGPKTIVPKISYQRDWCCEGFTEEEVEMHIKKINLMVPAAGN